MDRAQLYCLNCTFYTQVDPVTLQAPVVPTIALSNSIFLNYNDTILAHVPEYWTLLNITMTNETLVNITIATGVQIDPLYYVQ